MKRFLLSVASFLGLGAGAAYAVDDVWSVANTAVTTASSNTVAILILAIGIAAAFFGYAIVKRVLRNRS